MSAQTELKEVLEWIADLIAGPPVEAPDDALSGDSWKLVRANLETASGHFGDAADAPEAKATGVVPEAKATGLAHDVRVELARDLQREATSLAQRARVLSRRARPKSAEERRAETEARTAVAKAKTAEAEATRSEAEARIAAAKASAAEAEATVSRLPRVKESVTVRESELTAAQPSKQRIALDKGATSVETARNHLDDAGTIAGAAESFAQELDLLAEMTLRLRERCP